MTDEKRGETFVMRGEASPASSAIAFNTFIIGLASTTLIHLGEAANPDTGRTERNLELARESLELLSMLREKTRGNLTEEEEGFLVQAVPQLQLLYVRKAG